jgi:hypothetical protein
VVKLKRSLRQWPAGTVGTVLSEHGTSKLVEIADDRGQELDMFPVDEEDLELLAKHLP